MSSCWRGYEATWEVENNRLCLLIIYVVPHTDGKNVLESIFPGEPNGRFADWFFGKIEAPLSEVIKSIDGEEVAAKRTLELVFNEGLMISEDVILECLSTPRDIENGLTSPDVEVRRGFAKSLEAKATPEQIVRGILDEDSTVRVSFMQADYSSRARFSFTPEQLERVLTDTSDGVRRYATMFVNCEPTPFQLERALNDKSSVIRGNMVRHFADRLTPEQIERGLTDEDGNVRHEYAVWVRGCTG